MRAEARTRFVAGLVVLLAIGIANAIVGCRPPDAVDNDVPMRPAQVQTVLDRLPHTVRIEDREAVIDRETVPQTERDEYSAQEAPTEPREDEDPVDYVERILVDRLSEEHIAAQARFFDHEASAYPLDDEGVVVFLRVSDIPDDSIGATEERFDLISVDGRWRLEWYGARHFCRRPGQEFWAPADELCP
jgi:hypothetical protein